MLPGKTASLFPGQSLPGLLAGSRERFHFGVPFKRFPSLAGGSRMRVRLCTADFSPGKHLERQHFPAEWCYPDGEGHNTGDSAPPL